MGAVQVRVEVLSEGLAALMQEAGMVSATDAAAERIASIAGFEFEAKPAQTVGDRPMALVVPVGIEGMEEEARDKVLSKAVSACRS